MPFVIFVAPYLTPIAARMIEATADLPDVQLGVISQEPLDKLAPAPRPNLAQHWRVDDGWNTAQIVAAARLLGDRLGPIHRLFGAAEHLQVQRAEVREQLGVPGLGIEAAWNFRDNTTPANYLAQLASMGAFIGVPVERDGDDWKYKIVKNLTQRPAQMTDDQSVNTLIRWYNQNQQWTVAIFRQMGLNAAGDHFAVFFPRALEEEFASEEERYLKGHNLTVNDVSETHFRLVRQGNRYVPKAVEHEKGKIR